MTLSVMQQTALALAPKITASLSVLCSSTIAWIVLRDPMRRGKVFHRLILGMSLTDLVTSFWWVLSTWPIPKESGVLWAVGTTRTCTCQGFFLQLGIANPLYNLSLSVYYLLAVHWSWGEARLRKVEYLFHLGPLGWGLTTALIGLPLKIFNSANLWCWIANHPGRNEHTSPYRWGIFYAPLWLAWVLLTINLTRLVTYFRRITLTTEKHLALNPSVYPTQSESEQIVMQQQISNNARGDFPESEDIDDDVEEELGIHYCSQTGRESVQDLSCAVENISELSQCSPVATKEVPDSTCASTNPVTSNFKTTASLNSTFRASRFASRRQRLAFQCLRYALVFYVTWFPITLLRILQAIGHPIKFPLLLAAAILTPLQGLPNFLVYLYPIFLRRREKLNSGEAAREEGSRVGGCCRILKQKLLPTSSTTIFIHNNNPWPSRRDTPNPNVQRFTTLNDSNPLGPIHEDGEHETSGPSNLDSKSSLFSLGGILKTMAVTNEKANHRPVSSLAASQTDFDPSESRGRVRWGENAQPILNQTNNSNSPLTAPVQPKSSAVAVVEAVTSTAKKDLPPPVPSRARSEGLVITSEATTDNSHANEKSSKIGDVSNSTRQGPLTEQELLGRQDSSPAQPKRLQSDAPLLDSELEDKEESEFDSSLTESRRLLSEVPVVSAELEDKEVMVNDTSPRPPNESRNGSYTV